ncbi:MAG TPA: tryptophan--tRNA ligase [Rhodanobacteraceae bacterium]|nr:tryptophan--tRNA ligase [Rhodanobacteraceae bacterium]
MHTRVLTGITTTGTPHLGNYVGAIRPAVATSRKADVDAFYFMADYHALIKCDDPARVKRSRLEIAATWLACGLDVDKVTLYRQSDIPEIPQLTWLLTCVTAKGLLNRAHAYKAAVDKNTGAGEDADAGITAGLYMYPVLMAADILAFNANQVPVGRDQVQHIEMARDIAQRFNHIYGGDFFVLPEVSIEEDVATLPGLDGRKMSKSYDNTIPLFEGGGKRMREAILRIVTDSREPGEPKDPDASSLFAIYKAFAGTEAAAAFRTQLEQGMAWGEAKQALYERIESEVAPMRVVYDKLMAHPDDIEDILQAGAAKARAVATPLLETLREAVGLGKGGVKKTDKAGGRKRKADKSARVVSFRDADGSFRFRLLAANGDQLALSLAHADPKAAGMASRRLLASAADVETREDDGRFAVVLGEEVLAHAVDAAAAERISPELQALAATQET